MDPDKYQQAWQTQSAQTRVTIHADLLLKEVQRHQQDFQSTIFWRDFREVGVALLMLPIWVYMGVTMALPWTWYLTMPVLVWNVVFLLTYRVRRRQKPVVSGGPLLHCVKDSLAQVEDQIWLKRNYFWWSLLPFSFSVLTFVFHLAWMSENWPDAVGHLGMAFFVLVLYSGVYYTNNKYGCLPFEQRRQELLKLRSSLSDETGSPNAHDADSYEIVPASVSPLSEQSFVTPRTSTAKLAIGFIGLAAATLLLGAGVYFVVDRLQGGGYPTRSPFAAVRWQESQPEVQLGEDWFVLVSLDEIPASEIVAFSQKTYADLWQKRFEEDLVEVLTRMGHPPQDTVTLAVQSLTSGEKSIREGVPMTRANRTAIRNAAQKRTIQNPQRQNDQRNSSTSKLAPLVEFFESIVRPGKTANKPLAPEFDDVSAFGEGDISQVDAWLQAQVALAEYPSLNVAVVRDGKIVYQRAFGLEDIETGRKASPETSYHVASVTKVFTTSLAVMLDQRGVVDLDKPVASYLPKDVSISTSLELGATITLRQLASHTSGLPRGIPGQVQSVEGRYELEPKRLYDHLAGVSLESAPGTDELYSNLGMGLLGHALELAADKPFDQLLQEMICEPLHLERTTIHADDRLRMATGYGGTTPRRPETHSFRERLAPSGGLLTSTEDLSKFLAAQMRPGVFSSDMLKQLHTETKLLDGTITDTALGWSVRSRHSVGRILKKSGGRNNCDAWIGFAPEHGVGVVVVTNCGDPSVDDIGYWLLERSIPGGPQPVTKHGYAKVAPYTGVRWENDRPVVRVQDRWSPLVSIDGIPVDRIMEFAKQEYGEKSRKRFVEDLVEVLSTMGHEPEWEVTLGLETKDGQVEQLTIRMTAENRNLAQESLQEAD